MITKRTFHPYLFSRTPPENYKLQYVEVIQRHHKRTPYASNIFFKEDVEWTCVDSSPTFGSIRCVAQFKRASMLTMAYSSQGEGKKFSPVQWQAFTDPRNPWISTQGPGFFDSTYVAIQMHFSSARIDRAHTLSDASSLKSRIRVCKMPYFTVA